MKITRNKILIFLVIFIVFITIFLKGNIFLEQKIQAQRILKKISYSIQQQFATALFSDEHIKVPVTFHKQEHALSCEVAALRMSLNYLGVSVTEDDLLEKLVFDTREPKSRDNIWGDPEEGFVGDIDGSVFLGTGFGVYDGPIRDLALNYRKAVIIEQPTLSKVLEEVDKGNPVIAWGLLSNRKPIKWKTKEGKDIIIIPGEHARVVMGYSGSISNPTKIILMDPIYGKIRMSKEKFLADWSKMNNKAVVIY